MWADVKKLNAILALVAAVSLRAGTAAAQAPPSGGPAKAAHIAGAGTCRVVFDADGRVANVVVVESTGSQILDKNTVNYARKNWTGKPNTTVTVPIYYQLSKSATKTLVHYHTPAIPYPYVARANHIHGSGSVQVTFDERGKAITAKMTRSTGSSVLDEATTSYAKANWTSTGGERSTVEVPVLYP